uniref:Uncharacterized protein n=1 Tax=Myoviridae sp. ctHFk21 TaxID=2823538 RepID=A0A8S5L6D1_9CAUD|nr:MAG TPA: hypothetical protein [Myoviridae sp. ctHFk21]
MVAPSVATMWYFKGCSGAGDSVARLFAANARALNRRVSTIPICGNCALLPPRVPVHHARHDDDPA